MNAQVNERNLLIDHRRPRPLNTVNYVALYCWRLGLQFNSALACVVGRGGSSTVRGGRCPLPLRASHARLSSFPLHRTPATQTNSAYKTLYEKDSKTFLNVIRIGNNYLMSVLRYFGLSVFLEAIYKAI